MNQQSLREHRFLPLSFLEKKPFVIMGIVNVTPDSFSDGGQYYLPENACDHAMRLADEGADIIDIGGESSRPGAASVSVEEELRRVIPVIEKIRACSPVAISIDTSKSAVAAKALSCGATLINDISAGRFDPAMASVAAKNGCPVVLMHSRKSPSDMQIDPLYSDVVQEVLDELFCSVDSFVSHGVAKENIILDPGIGFAKRFQDNITLVRNIRTLVNTGYPILLGASRKSLVGQLTGKKPPDRLPGSLACVGAAYFHGVKIFRVHDVDATRDFLTVLSTIETCA